MEHIVKLGGSLFWSSVMVILALAVAVVILRTLRSRVPATAGAVSAVTNATGLSV